MCCVCSSFMLTDACLLGPIQMLANLSCALTLSARFGIKSLQDETIVNSNTFDSHYQKKEEVLSELSLSSLQSSFLNQHGGLRNENEDE